MKKFLSAILASITFVIAFAVFGCSGKVNNQVTENEWDTAFSYVLNGGNYSLLRKLNSRTYGINNSTHDVIEETSFNDEIKGNLDFTTNRAYFKFMDGSDYLFDEVFIEDYADKYTSYGYSAEADQKWQKIMDIDPSTADNNFQTVINQSFGNTLLTFSAMKFAVSNGAQFNTIENLYSAFSYSEETCAYSAELVILDNWGTFLDGKVSVCFENGNLSRVTVDTKQPLTADEIYIEDYEFFSLRTYDFVFTDIGKTKIPLSDSDLSNLRKL